MLKVLVACENGSGTGLMMKDRAKTALISFGINDLHIDYCYLDRCQTDNYDLIFCPIALVDDFKHAEEKGIKVIAIKNILSQYEFKQSIISSGYLEDLKNK